MILISFHFLLSLSKKTNLNLSPPNTTNLDKSCPDSSQVVFFFWMGGVRNNPRRRTYVLPYVALRRAIRPTTGTLIHTSPTINQSSIVH